MIGSRYLRVDGLLNGLEIMYWPAPPDWIPTASERGRDLARRIVEVEGEMRLPPGANWTPLWQRLRRLKGIGLFDGFRFAAGRTIIANDPTPAMAESFFGFLFLDDNFFAAVAERFLAAARRLSADCRWIRADREIEITPGAEAGPEAIVDEYRIYFDGRWGMGRVPHSAGDPALLLFGDVVLWSLRQRLVLRGIGNEGGRRGYADFRGMPNWSFRSNVRPGRWIRIEYPAPGESDEDPPSSAPLPSSVPLSLSSRGSIAGIGAPNVFVRGVPYSPGDAVSVPLRPAEDGAESEDETTVPGRLRWTATLDSRPRESHRPFRADESAAVAEAFRSLGTTAVEASRALGSMRDSWEQALEMVSDLISDDVVTVEEFEERRAERRRERAFALYAEERKRLDSAASLNRFRAVGRILRGDEDDDDD